MTLKLLIASCDNDPAKQGSVIDTLPEGAKPGRREHFLSWSEVNPKEEWPNKVIYVELTGNNIALEDLEGYVGVDCDWVIDLDVLERRDIGIVYEEHENPLLVDEDRATLLARNWIIRDSADFTVETLFKEKI